MVERRSRGLLNQGTNPNPNPNSEKKKFVKSVDQRKKKSFNDIVLFRQWEGTPVIQRLINCAGG